MINLNCNIFSTDFLGDEFDLARPQRLKNQNILLKGFNDGLKHLLLCKNQNFVLVVKDMVLAKQYQAGILGFGQKATIFNEIPQNLVFNKQLNTQLINQNIETLFRLYSNESFNLIITAGGLINFVSQKAYFENTIYLKKGQTIPINILTKKLAELGYNRVESIAECGFCLRGDTLDIRKNADDLPYRISFFDDEIESIREFDFESGIKIREVLNLTILPILEFDFSTFNLFNFEQMAQAKLKQLLPTSGQRLSDIVQQIKFKIENKTFDDSLNWAMEFVESKTSIFEYLPQNRPIFFDDQNLIFDTLLNNDTQLQENLKSLKQAGEILNENFCYNVGLKTVQQALNNYLKIDMQNIFNKQTLFSTEKTITVECERPAKYYMDYKLLIKDLMQKQAFEKTVILCFGKIDRAEGMLSSLTEQGIMATVIENFTEVDHIKGGIYLAPFSIETGFNLKGKFSLLGNNELVKKIENRVAKNALKVLPQIGDYVVHEVHGIGKFIGLKTIEQLSKKEYLNIEYQNGDMLYVPIDQIFKLSRYSGGEKKPAISKIGGASFEKVKQRVKNSLSVMAIDLAGLYKKRQNAKGFAYPQDCAEQKLFEDSFAHTETIDQLESVLDIKKDMESGKVMDRLICGDVGYGKTEVALRAIFKTVMAGKQSAIIVPTTILAKQHFITANQRFDNFGINTKVLTRLSTPAETKEILQGLKAGSVDVVIATHRLLSEDIKFKELGLLVLDEEQRFGVEHKEKIKVIKNNLNVLTMSATPIPRTLNMALSGLRDISLLETPPQNRLPVDTIITEYSDVLVTQACTKEIARGGQVFILYNQVESIDDFALNVQKLVAGARVLVTHGRLNPTVLDERINAFYEKKADILVTTTIIENGIDVADANTLIVINSDRFGLNSLYQIRGRVGRSTRLAKAYFTVPKKTITQNAEARLKALMQNTSLGSGFKIAMADLEIRGAGDVLGKKQSGHIADVGYELYCKLLAEAVSEVNGKVEKALTDTEIIADVDAYIPNSYMPEQNQKITYYQKISQLSSVEGYNSTLKQLAELYGEVPVAITNLMDLCLIKNIFMERGGQKIYVTKFKNEVVFENADIINSKAIVNNCADMQKYCFIEFGKTPKIVFYPQKNTNDNLRIIKNFALGVINLKN